MNMEFPPGIQKILDDRESGSIALLERLISALETELDHPGASEGQFAALLEGISKELAHFAAIENLLASLSGLIRQNGPFPATVTRFFREYRDYWRNSEITLTDNLLQHCNPQNRTFFTHSHSQTVISVLDQLHARGIRFRVLQTISTPGGEGRIALERMHQMHLHAELIDEAVQVLDHSFLSKSIKTSYLEIVEIRYRRLYS